MLLLFSLKALGKKRPTIHQQEIELSIAVDTTVQEFLKKLVEHQVGLFNNKKEGENLLRHLSEASLQTNLNQGSVKFGHQYNFTPADEEKATETVRQGFEDGLIALFQNDQQLEKIEDKITLKEKDNFTILRLTFLSGSFW